MHKKTKKPTTVNRNVLTDSSDTCKDIERELLSIWSDLLGNKSIRVDDDFFFLGGTSLLAIHMILRLQQRLMVEIPTHLLIEAPTVETFALKLSKIEKVSPLPSVRRAASKSNHQQLYPLSFPQQRLWFVSQVDEQAAAYNMPWNMAFEGNLNTESLRRSIERIVHRHESLRTVFKQGDDGSVYQSILAEQDFNLPIHDLSGFSAAEQVRKITEFKKNEERSAFDLAADLMLRGTLLRLDTESYLLLLTLHHIATDGWSHQVLQRELSHFYTVEQRRESPRLPDLDVQYKDFSLWQQNSASRHRVQMDYWQNQLHKLPDLELPTDQPRPEVQRNRGSSISVNFPSDLTRRLRSIASELHVTNHMLLLAAFQILLQRYSGQNDFGVLVPIAGRNDPDLVHQVGCFINLLVVRADLSGDPCFSELAGRVRDTSLNAYSHQEVPYEHIVDRVCNQRDLSRNPLAQVLFQFSDVASEAPTFPNLKVTQQPSLGSNARFDIELNLILDQETIAGELVFNTDIFQQATITRFAEHFLNLLKSLAENTSQPISNLQMLSATELHKALENGNQTSVKYPEGNGVHQLFEEQVSRTPNVVAIESGGLKLSYRELDDRANHLASDLRGHGLQTGETVGVCMDRSPESVVGILGILKAGAAYVPLDPDFPEKRLESMIQDAAVSMIVTKREFSAGVPSDMKAIYINDDFVPLKNRSSDVITKDLSPDSPAYVMFTSGSTGKPKGVVMPHKALRNLVQWQTTQEWM